MPSGSRGGAATLVQVQTGSTVFAVDAEANDTYVATLSPAISSLTNGMVVRVSFNTVNTGAATLNLNGLGAVTIKKMNDQDLDDGDIEAGQIATLVYDGTADVFQMQSQIAAAVSATNITVADESADTTTFPMFANEATGSIAPKTDASAYTYDASTGALSATSFVGALTGQADTVATITGLAPDTATTQATQPNITTAAALVSIQNLTVTLADAGANAIFGWDDTASAYENLTQAEVLAVIGSASLTAQGVVELATGAETNTGTDATRAVTPDGLDDWTGSAQVVTVGTLSAGDATAIVDASSATASGIVELATIAEVDTGTDTVRAITPAGLAGSALQSKVDGVEALADVTDEGNVIPALDGATISTATVATGDKVLLQDIDDSDNLKTVTAQSIADLASSGGAVMTTVLVPQPMLGFPATSTVGMSVNTTAFVGLFNIPGSITIDTVSFDVSAVGTAGTVDFCIYSEDGQTRHTIDTTGTISATGVHTLTLGTPFAITAGYFYLYIGTNGTADITTRRWQDGIGLSPSSQPILAGTLTVTAGTPPATFDPTVDVSATGDAYLFCRFDT